MPRENTVVILGVFVADTAYRAERMPRMGETILGQGFALGPGGKGSNQAVAAARLGAEVHFVGRLGDDAFADMALETWEAAGVRPAVAGTRRATPAPPSSSSTRRAATTRSSSAPARRRASAPRTSRRGRC